MAKVGRKGKAYETADGTIYPDLRRRKDGRFYVNRYPLKILELSTRDEREAIKRYLTLKGETDNEWVKGKSIHPDVAWHAHEIPEEHLIEIFVQWLTTKPKWLSQRTGIEELAYLDKLEKPKSLSLEAMGNLFKQKNISKQEIDSTIYDWNEFIKAVSATNISEVNEEGIQKYNDFLISKKFAPKTIRHKIGRVNAILNYARPRNKSLIKTIDIVLLDIKTMVNMPKKTKYKPNPLYPEEFRAMIDNAKPQFNAILVTSLNLALHPKELSEVRQVELDIKHHSFATNRVKGGVSRCAYIWNETIKLVKPYLDKNKEYLFYQDDDRMHDKNSLGREWTRTAKRAGVKGRSFDSLRSSCRTTMVGFPEAADFVMGHEGGMRAVYTFRESNRTKEALEQVRQKYL